MSTWTSSQTGDELTAIEIRALHPATRFRRPLADSFEVLDGKAKIAYTKVIPPEPAPLTLDERKQAMLSQLPSLRSDAQANGLLYTFPDGSTGKIQTRNTIDTGNINGLATQALVLQSQGIADAVMPFRVAENETKMLTPGQMIEMATAASNFVSGTYATKWAKEAEIANLTEETIDAYDVTAGWS